MNVSLDQDLLNTMTPEERAEIEGSDDAERASLAAAGAAKDPRHTGGDIANEKPGENDDGGQAGEAAGGGEGGKSGEAAAAEGTAAAAAGEGSQAEGAAAAGASDAGGAAAGAGAADEAAAAAAAGQAAAAPAPAPAQAADDPVPAGSVRPPPPAYQFELPADFEERMATVKEAQGSLLDRFEAGDITKEEMRKEQDRLADERHELDSMRSRAEMAEDMRRQSGEVYRQQAIGALMDAAAKPEHGGIDYRKDAAKLADLDTFVRTLAANEANADKPLEWFLNEAHRRVRVLHGVAQPAPAPAPAPAEAGGAKPAAAAAPAADPLKAAADKRRQDIPNDVDLSSLPGGADASDTDGEFGDIMALEGDAFEDAIAKMARNQPERWARFQAQRQ